MDLKDTVKLMESDKYWQRFQAETLQLRIRIEKLAAMLEKWDRGALDFAPVCPRTLLEKQLRAMRRYLEALEERAEIEGIEV